MNAQEANRLTDDYLFKQGGSIYDVVIKEIAKAVPRSYHTYSKALENSAFSIRPKIIARLEADGYKVTSCSGRNETTYKISWE